MNKQCKYGNIHWNDAPCAKCQQEAIKNLPAPDFDPPKARNSDPAPSQEAAEDMTESRASELRIAVLEFVAANPLRGQRACWESTGEEQGTITPRYAELEDAGLIIKDGRCDDGKPKTNGEPRSVTAYRVTTPEERAVFAGRSKSVKSVDVCPCLRRLKHSAFAV